MERKIFTIKKIWEESGQVKVFSLSPEDGKNISFKPGQFAMIFQLDNSGKFGALSRPYSIASSPDNPNLRFVIKITGGQFTSVLDRMKEGEKLGVAAPFGHFAYESEEKIICLAAGTGVAPMLGLLEYVAQKKKKGKFTLFYSNKRREGIICMDLLEKFRAENQGIKIVYTLTQERFSDWKGELGRLNEEMIKKHANYVPNATVFICGPMEFANSMRKAVLRLGADEKRIRAEAWG